MPSKSPAQARLMAAAAHTKGGFGGVSQSVGKEFNRADKGSTMLSKGMKPQTMRYAEGGPVLGKESAFMKTPDRFRDGSGKNDESWGKGSSKANPKGADKKIK